jgi:glycosyltransferase involved in cell wall biosynthesis
VPRSPPRRRTRIVLPGGGVRARGPRRTRAHPGCDPNLSGGIISVTPSTPVHRDIEDLAAAAGIWRVHILAWRDLDDPEAGGSEIHAASVARTWAEAGLEVTMRTSHAQGQPPEGSRDGYRVIRRSGRHLVFPSAIAGEVLGWHGPRDALLEVWNGVPFLSPIWSRGPRAVMIHHVHRNMWDLVLAERLARFGRLLEGTLAPPFYRRTPIVTPSSSSKGEIVELLGLPAGNISVVPPGIDERFQPGGEKSPHPLVIAVGRLMPPKRFDELIRIVAEVRRDHPTLELVICGEGYEKTTLQQVVADLDASSWVRLAGRVSDDELLELYQQAWVVASASIAEGWGLTMSEAAACGTPAVASRIAGHVDSVADGESGLLGASSRELVGHLDAVLRDAELRERLSEGARKHAINLSWEACALNTFLPLAEDARRRRAAAGRP